MTVFNWSRIALNGSVFPQNFEFPLLITVYTMVILGGAGSQAGVVVGAVIVSVLLEALRDPGDARSLFYVVILLSLVAVFRGSLKLAVVVGGTVLFGIAARLLAGAIDESWTAGPVDETTGRPQKFAYPPNLVVVDGGPPQVAAAAAALAELGIDDVALCGLALMTATALVNLGPENPYLAYSLAIWRQGHFLNFNGLTRLVSTLWPFAALAYVLAVAARGRGVR